jgi:hypothetical protein
MPSQIHVRTASTIGEDAAILTAFTTFLAAVKAATTHKVDAGGTMIAGIPRTGDEVGLYLRQGDPY